MANKCKMCGRCCGIIPASATEIAKIDKYLQKKSVNVVKREAPLSFESTHPWLSGSVFGGNTICPFLNGAPTDKKRTCAIYQVRPGICRAFPHDVAMNCPNNVGPKYSRETVKKIAFKNGSDGVDFLNRLYERRKGK